MTPMRAEPRRMNSAPMVTRTAPRNMTAWKVRRLSTEASAEPSRTAAMARKATWSPLTKPTPPWRQGRGSLERPPSERGLVLAEAVGLVVEVAHVGGGLELLAHADAVGGAGLLAQRAVHALRDLDGGELLALVLRRVEAGVVVDHVAGAVRARLGAEGAADAGLELEVDAAAEAVGHGLLLLGVLDGDGLAEEVLQRDAHALEDGDEGNLAGHQPITPILTITAVSTKLRMDKGSRTFQATLRYWSTRTRGSVTHTQKTTKDMSSDFSRNHSGAVSGPAMVSRTGSTEENGACQPPR